MTLTELVLLLAILALLHSLSTGRPRRNKVFLPWDVIRGFRHYNDLDPDSWDQHLRRYHRLLFLQNQLSRMQLVQSPSAPMKPANQIYIPETLGRFILGEGRDSYGKLMENDSRKARRYTQKILSMKKALRNLKRLLIKSSRLKTDASRTRSSGRNTGSGSVRHTKQDRLQLLRKVLARETTHSTIANRTVSVTNSTPTPNQTDRLLHHSRSSRLRSMGLPNIDQVPSTTRPTSSATVAPPQRGSRCKSQPRGKRNGRRKYPGILTTIISEGKFGAFGSVHSSSSGTWGSFASPADSTSFKPSTQTRGRPSQEDAFGAFLPSDTSSNSRGGFGEFSSSSSNTRGGFGGFGSFKTTFNEDRDESTPSPASHGTWLDGPVPDDQLGAVELDYMVPLSEDNVDGSVAEEEDC